MVALGFAVLEVGGSATALGQVLAAHTGALLLVLLWGGVVSDRFPRTLVIQLANLVAALSQGTLAALVLTDVAELRMMIALSAVNGVAAAFAYPALGGLLPQLVHPHSLQRANTILGFGSAAFRVLGPTIGGVVVAAAGAGWALAADAAAWLLSALLLLPVRVSSRSRSSASSSAISELRAGWTFVRTTTWFRTVVSAFAVTNLLYYGGILTLGPVVAASTVGLKGWGFVLSAQAVGLLIASVVLLRIRLSHPLRAGMLGIAVLGLPIFLLGAHPTLPALLIAMLVAGIGTEVFQVGWSVAMQEHIPRDMLARAYSYDLLGSYVAIPIGQLTFGPLATAFGADTVLMLAGVAYAAVSLLTLLSRPVRNLDRRAATSATAG